MRYAQPINIAYRELHRQRRQLRQMIASGLRDNAALVCREDKVKERILEICQGIVGLC